MQDVREIDLDAFFKRRMEHQARNPSLRRSSRRPRRTYEMGCASRDLADTMCGVPATVRNLGSHLLAAWRPYDPFDGPDGRGQNCQTKNPARATLHLLK